MSLHHNILAQNISVWACAALHSKLSFSSFQILSTGVLLVTLFMCD